VKVNLYGDGNGGHLADVAAAHNPVVIAALGTIGAFVERDAAGRLEAHRTPEDRHHVLLTHGDVDTLVILEGPAPLSVEFGRRASAKRRGTPALHILTGSIPGRSF